MNYVDVYKHMAKQAALGDIAFKGVKLAPKLVESAAKNISLNPGSLTKSVYTAGKNFPKVVKPIANTAAPLRTQALDYIGKSNTLSHIQDWLYKFWNGQNAAKALENARVQRWLDLQGRGMTNGPKRWQKLLKEHDFDTARDLWKKDMARMAIKDNPGKLTGAQKVMTAGVPAAIGYEAFKEDPQPVYIQPPQQSLWDKLFG